MKNSKYVELRKKEDQLRQECLDIENEIEAKRVELALTESELETVVQQLAGRMGK